MIVILQAFQDISPHLSAELQMLNRFYCLNLHAQFVFCPLLRLETKVLIISDLYGWVLFWMQ